MGFLGGLLSAATSLIPGIGPIISSIVPGAVDTISDIINRPKDQSIGEALLKSAPKALGLVSSASEHFAKSGGNVGKIAETIGDIAKKTGKVLNKSLNVTDHLPIVHGTPTQAMVKSVEPLLTKSGPLSVPGIVPTDIESVGEGTPNIIHDEPDRTVPGIITKEREHPLVRRDRQERKEYAEEKKKIPRIIRKKTIKKTRK